MLITPITPKVIAKSNRGEQQNSAEAQARNRPSQSGRRPVSALRFHSALAVPLSATCVPRPRYRSRRASPPSAPGSPTHPGSWIRPSTSTAARPIRPTAPTVVRQGGLAPVRAWLANVSRVRLLFQGFLQQDRQRVLSGVGQHGACGGDPLVQDRATSVPSDPIAPFSTARSLLLILTFLTLRLPTLPEVFAGQARPRMSYPLWPPSRRKRSRLPFLTVRTGRPLGSPSSNVQGTRDRRKPQFPEWPAPFTSKDFSVNFGKQPLSGRPLRKRLARQRRLARHPHCQQHRGQCRYQYLHADLSGRSDKRHCSIP